MYKKVICALWSWKQLGNIFTIKTAPILLIVMSTQFWVPLITSSAISKMWRATEVVQRCTITVHTLDLEVWLGAILFCTSKLNEDAWRMLGAWFFFFFFVLTSGMNIFVYLKVFFLLFGSVILNCMAFLAAWSFCRIFCLVCSWSFCTIHFFLGNGV